MTGNALQVSASRKRKQVLRRAFQLTPSCPHTLVVTHLRMFITHFLISLQLLNVQKISGHQTIFKDHSMNISDPEMRFIEPLNRSLHLLGCPFKILVSYPLLSHCLYKHTHTHTGGHRWALPHNLLPKVTITSVEQAALQRPKGKSPVWRSLKVLFCPACPASETSLTIIIHVFPSLAGKL